jgi:hypothetical protein
MHEFSPSRAIGLENVFARRTQTRDEFIQTRPCASVCVCLFITVSRVQRTYTLRVKIRPERNSMQASARMQRRTCAGARAGISDYCYVFRKLYMYYITLFISTCMIECRSNTNMVLSASERAQTDRPPFKLKEYAARGPQLHTYPLIHLYISPLQPPPRTRDK